MSEQTTDTVNPGQAIYDALSEEAKAKADDLVKMHAYRDAIPELRCAVVLFPGSVAEFRTTVKEKIADITVGDVLTGDLNGVGAIPMSPVGVNDD